ncbi:TPA_asm: P2 [Erysimum trirhavirus 1]|nr:TPA_asm: P2 [Erysimum trirhavirus 1]
MEFTLFLALMTMMMPQFSTAEANDRTDIMYGDSNWAQKFKEVADESKALQVMDRAMEKKIGESIRKAEVSMIKSKKKTTYITINQNVHLGRQDEKVNIQKMDLLDRLSRWAYQYPWVSLRKMTVMWKTGVSNNVRWGVKMSFVDRRDNNDETRELFMMEYPVSDNFIMMMSPGYTAHMSPVKGLLPWRFDFDFPDGEFTDRTVFGTLKIKLEIDQYREATQVDEIPPMVKFTRVQKTAEEPTLRWMSKGKWYQSSATRPDPVQLDTIQTSLDDLQTKYHKFMAFLGFDPVKLKDLPCANTLWGMISKQDIELFESNPLIMAKSYSAYQEKYKEIVRREMAKSVYVN